MGVFPIFVRLRGKSVAVVGGGSVAESKVASLVRAGALVRVIAPSLTPRLAQRARCGDIEWWEKHFEPQDLEGAFLVIAATSAAGVNEGVFEEAERRGILCNAVDDPEHCHFYCGAVVERGDLQIAVSTNGKSPALAQRLRKELETQFGAEYGLWLQWLGEARAAVRALHLPEERAKAVLHALASEESFDRFMQGSGIAASGGRRT